MVAHSTVATPGTHVLLYFLFQSIRNYYTVLKMSGEKQAKSAAHMNKGERKQQSIFFAFLCFLRRLIAHVLQIYGLASWPVVRFKAA